MQITQVHFQKNVNVTVTEGGRSTMFRLTHAKFWEYIEENRIECFTYRPADPQFQDLVDQRNKKVARKGFEVEESNDNYYYMIASR